ncbi:mCG147541 [Mus musculus]|nr:mCG147541 [Mus musculus]
MKHLPRGPRRNVGSKKKKKAFHGKGRAICSIPWAFSPTHFLWGQYHRKQYFSPTLMASPHDAWVKQWREGRCCFLQMSLKIIPFLQM